MEYPMATLLAGPGLGGAFHEWMHSWYQGMLGTNESMYAWMDEGFTSYAEHRVTAWFNEEMMRLHPDEKHWQDVVAEDRSKLPMDHSAAYSQYFALVKSGLEEPLTTHADHFNTNFAYGIASYSKGEMFIEQLGYIVGDSVRDRIMHERRVELAFEGLRHFDLMRWHIAGQVLNNVKDGIVPYHFEDKFYKWPLPQTEIDKSGGVLVQNPNY